MRQILTLCIAILLFSCHSAAQNPNPKRQTANDMVPKYEGTFRFGSNMGYYPPYTDDKLADIAAGNPELGVQGVGVNALRPALFEHFLEYWGYNIRLDAFQHYASLGINENVVFIGYPSPAHRDTTMYCKKESSVLFKNMYEPIWDNGENGTPVNDKNYYALYVYKTVKTYGKWVKFWEIWNEPDYSITVKSELPMDNVNSWWQQNPEPADYALHAPIQHYIRLLRISYEVIKAMDKNAYVCVGGLGYPSFLDAVLRQTDNPNNGIATAAYPLKGGAYFDVLSYHAYPHIDGSLRSWNNERNGFVHYRHSDKASDGVFNRKKTFTEVLKKYGYAKNGKFPEKKFIITECNIPRKEFGDFIGSDTAQRNFLVKTVVKAQREGILQFHPYSLGELKTENEAANEFDLMGLYEKLEGVQPYKSKPTAAGIAYRTASQALAGFRYDSAQTQALMLPYNADGGAFVNKDGQTVYCLWARTRLDRSETASGNYSFPEKLGITHVQVKDWDYSKTFDAQIISSQNITLTGSPQFFRSMPADLKKFPEDEAIFCLPNPNNNEMLIHFRVPENGTLTNLQLYCVNGREQKKLFDTRPMPKGVHQWRINTKDAKAGLYVVQLSIDNETYSRKFMIQH
jgi:hypothetical protein